MITVTKPYLPPKSEFDKLVNEAWDRNWLTNDGPLVQRLEKELESFLGVKHLVYVSNGTIAIQLAIRALELSQEIITTPFSHISTTTSILWEHCTPIFADIDKETYNIDSEEILNKINPKTTGILATHIYGNPCDINSINEVAKNHKLKVIYDASHCFNTKHKGTSVLNYGDISTISFHASKLFHTIEGGAIITQDEDLYKKLKYLRNFGHDGPFKFYGIGINGKNSEFHAAMGLTNLNHVQEILGKRIAQVELYKNLLASTPIKCQKINEQSEWNCAYNSILLDSEEICIKVENALKAQDIFPRRYFYPSLSELEHLNPMNMPVSKDIARRILCLPLYHTLENEDIERICHIIKTTLG